MLSCGLGSCAQSARGVMGANKHMYTQCAHTHMTTLLGSAGLMDHSWASFEGRGLERKIELRLSLFFLPLSLLVLSFLPICTSVSPFSFSLSPSLSFFLVTPWRAGMRGQIISAQVLHHYLLSDKPLGHSITVFLSLVHQ